MIMCVCARASTVVCLIWPVTDVCGVAGGGSPHAAVSHAPTAAWGMQRRDLLWGSHQPGFALR